MISIKEHEDDSEDFNPSTPQGKNMAQNLIWLKRNKGTSPVKEQTHRSRKKTLTSKKAPISTTLDVSIQKHVPVKPITPSKVDTSLPISRDQHVPISIDDSTSMSSNDNVSINTNSTFDTRNAVKRHLLLDSPDPPESLYGLGIKCLCHHYSKIKDKPFEPIDLSGVLRDIDQCEDSIEWNGPNGVSKFCNDMEPKHFGECDFWKYSLCGNATEHSIN